MRGRFGPYGRGFPMNTISWHKRHWRRAHRTTASFDGLRQLEIEVGKNLTLRTPHGLKVVARRRAANKRARVARRRNR